MAMSNELLAFLLDHEDFRKARLPSLYSDFTALRTSNPDGFAANFTAWKNVLSAAALRGLTSPTTTTTGSQATSAGGDRLVLKIDPNLMRALATQEWGMPGALPTVVNEAVNKREFIPQKAFLESQQTIYHNRLIDPWNVVSWGLQKTGLADVWILQQLGLVSATHASSSSSSSGNKLATERFVVVENVEKVANSVIKSMAKRTRKVDKVLTMEAFQSEVDGMITGLDSHPSLSDFDVKVLLKYLTRDVREASVNGDNNVIKFKEAGESLTAVTEEDAAIARLKALILRLNKEVDELSSDIESLAQKAKAAVVAHNETRARYLLKSKAMANGAMKKKMDSLEQLEGVMQKVEQAGDNAEMVRTLEQSSRVLEKMNKETGGVEKVEEMLDKLRDNMYETEKIGEVLAEPGQMAVDMTEVEDEFEDLMKEEKEKERKEEEAQKKAKEDEEANKLAEILGSVSLTTDKTEVKPTEQKETADTASAQAQQSEKEEEAEAKPEDAIPAL